ncbi:MAG: MBOAT family protein [Alphaproteobacteria bacterium]|nr:MBOAT family protein [Alphaproteobacteria bacterium]
MLFSSMSFIYMFLPLVCAAYLLARNELQNYILLIASIVFYAWGEPSYLAIMILTILVNYVGANYISRSHNSTHRKWLLALTIAADLGVLFYFKYFNFVAENFNMLFHTHIDFIKVIMPIGISFYTFQALSYVVDVYRGDTPAQRDIYKLALYICLFPQLIAGPIVKYHDAAEQIEKRNVTFDKVAYGIKRFIIGLSKKMLLANTLGAVADKIFTQPVEQFDALTAWLGAAAYSFQLLYDFSGYSDMAIGLGSIFGFKFLENFNYPYISRSITEFWRRWHISLSTWFKEYLYIPLGGNRVARWRNYLNLFIVFLATGFWHGAAWNFIFWGLWHGMFIMFEKATGWHKKEGKFIGLFQHLYCILVFVIGWVMFRADTMTYAWQYIKNMFGMVKTHKVIYGMSYYVDNIEKIALIAAFLCAMPIFGKVLQIPYRYKVCRTLVNIWLILLFVLSTAFIAASTYNPFIYFRF